MMVFLKLVLFLFHTTRGNFAARKHGNIYFTGEFSTLYEFSLNYKHIKNWLAGKNGEEFEIGSNSGGFTNYF
jgi:hypothetical protein